MEAKRLPAIDLLMGHNTDEMATFLDNSYYVGSFVRALAPSSCHPHVSHTLPRQPATVYNTLLFSIFGLSVGDVKAEYANDGLPPGSEDGGLAQLDYMVRALLHPAALSAGSRPPQFTHYWFQCAKEAIAASAVTVGARAWTFRFNHLLSFGKDMWPLFDFPQCINKVCHASELFFVFGNVGNWSFTPEERALSNAMIDAWTNFAKTGDPNPPASAVARRLHSAAAPSWAAFADDSRLSLVLDSAFASESSDAILPAPPVPYCRWWDSWGYSKGGQGKPRGAAQPESDKGDWETVLEGPAPRLENF